jgi:hypothetical protein
MTASETVTIRKDKLAEIRELLKNVEARLERLSHE